MKGRRVFVAGNAAKEGVEDAVREVLPAIRKVAEVTGVNLDIGSDLSSVEADVILSFGGDGTLLSVARRLKGSQVPVLPVNMGRMGFLAEVPWNECASRLAEVLDGKCVISPRMMLEVRPPEGEGVLALNDAVVARGDMSRILRLEARVDGMIVGRHDGDGIIVATPTGSTAYSLSAGGPLVSPGVEAIVIAAICPHTLSTRPVVVSSSRTVEVMLLPSGPPAQLTVDGQVSFALDAGSRVKVKRASAPLRLVELPGRDWFNTVRQKLHWTSTEC
jgi:NAD+ kinase